MNVTHYTVQDFESNNELHTFKIELDGLTKKEYLQKCAVGLFRYSKSGTVISSRCQKCGHVIIDGTPTVCTECGSVQFSYKQTNETWALCDADGVADRFLGTTDLTPDFWAFNAFISDSGADSEVINGLLEDSVSFADIEDNVYQVQYLTDAEVNAEYADLNDNIFQDAYQDWPADEINDGFHPHHDFSPSHLSNEGYNI